MIGTYLNALAKIIASVQLPHQSNAQWYLFSSVWFVVLGAVLCPGKPTAAVQVAYGFKGAATGSF